MFEIGRTYNRSIELHDRYGGQRQGGISTPADYPFIFLFTGESGKQHGYSDGWDNPGVFLYTGEGQRGDMQFARGNLAISVHAKNGKSLHLFESRGKGECRYVGEFVCSTWEPGRGLDTEGAERSTIVFHLVPVNGPEVAIAGVELATANLDVLRREALAAASEAVRASESDAKRVVYDRSRAVKLYVLARAKGTCESCHKPAPFQRKDGSPYLEPHHTRRVSDGGPDHPRWVGAVCPNCHSEIHFGLGGKSKNTELEKLLGQVEAQF